MPRIHPSLSPAERDFYQHVRESHGGIPHSNTCKKCRTLSTKIRQNDEDRATAWLAQNQDSPPDTSGGASGGG